MTPEDTREHPSDSDLADEYIPWDADNQTPDEIETDDDE